MVFCVSVCSCKCVCVYVCVLVSMCTCTCMCVRGREEQTKEGKRPKTQKKERGETPRTQHRPPRRSRTKNQYNRPSNRETQKRRKRKLKNTQRKGNPKTRDNPWSLTKTRTPPMRKTQKLEDERWLRTTARTNKQAIRFFHMFSDSRRAKKIFSSKIEKNIFWTKNKDKFDAFFSKTFTSYIMA